VDFTDAEECFRRVNQRSRNSETKPLYRWGILEYDGRAWRGELWFADNLRLGPPDKQYEEATRGPRAVVVEAMVDCISQGHSPQVFGQLLEELAAFLSVVTGVFFHLPRQDKAWTWRLTEKAPTAR
jgi:hypothetical protein